LVICHLVRRTTDSGCTDDGGYQWNISSELPNFYNEQKFRSCLQIMFEIQYPK
jgi:hypothetical protein